MKKLNEYPTPKTDAESSIDEMGCPSVSTGLARDLERKLAMCRDALKQIASTVTHGASLAREALDKTK